MEENIKILVGELSFNSRLSFVFYLVVFMSLVDHLLGVPVCLWGSKGKKFISSATFVSFVEGGISMVIANLLLMVFSE